MRQSNRASTSSKTLEVFAVDEAKFQVFDADLIVTFKALEPLDIVVPEVTPQQALDIMCEQPRWWEKKEPKAVTTVASIREDRGAGRMGESFAVLV